MKKTNVDINSSENFNDELSQDDLNKLAQFYTLLIKIDQRLKKQNEIKSEK